MIEYQSLFHKKLLKGNFVYTAETTPPDSSDQEILLKKTKPLKGIADAINLTDSPASKSTHVIIDCSHYSCSE